MTFWEVLSTSTNGQTWVTSHFSPDSVIRTLLFLAICLAVSLYLATAKIVAWQVPWKLEFGYSFLQRLLLLPSQRFWSSVHAALRKVSAYSIAPMSVTNCETNQWQQTKCDKKEVIVYCLSCLSLEIRRLNLSLYFLNQARDETTVANVSCDVFRTFIKCLLFLRQSKDVVHSNLVLAQAKSTWKVDKNLIKLETAFCVKYPITNFSFFAVFFFARIF